MKSLSNPPVTRQLAIILIKKKLKACMVYGVTIYHILIQTYRSFSLSRNKKINWKPSSRRRQEKDYKTNIKTIYPSPRSLWPRLFLSYLLKRLTHLCRALCGDAILVYRFGAPIWPPEINKNIWSTGSTGTGGKPSTSKKTPAGIETIQRFGQKHSARPAN